MAITIALSVLLKVAFSFSFKHHASLPYSIADLTQQRYTLPFILKGNLIPSNNSRHSLNLTQPILTFAVTTALPTPLEFSLSFKQQNLFTVSTSLHNFSIESTVPSIIPLHFERTKCIGKLEVTLIIFAHLP